MNDASQEAALRASWWRASAALAVSLVLLPVIYHETLVSIVDIWIRSETFTHCFLIFPISGFLVWRRRSLLAGLVPGPSYVALAIVAVLGFVWLLGNLAEIGFVQQWAFVAMFPVVVWCVLGTAVASEIAFPLAFLLFSVPFGEFLIPRLINFTADFTFAMVKLTGIPVYREGTFLSLPSGDWSVIEACSGLRYLIASITLGTLFAYINYRSLLRRSLFILAATIVPVVANGLRAFMIVMIGHFSGMTLAVGVDHFIYGWVFFGLVMALLFWVGSFWTEDEGLEEAPAPVASLGEAHRWDGQPILASVLVLSIAVIWPFQTNFLKEHERGQTDTAKLEAPEPASPWVGAEPMTTWEPSFQGASTEQRAFFTDGHDKVAVYLKYYQTQKQDKELVNSMNRLLPRVHPVWKMPYEGLFRIKLGDTALNVTQGSLISSQQQLLAWQWYWIGGRYTANDYMAKFLEASNKLLGRPVGEAAIIVAVESHGDQEASKAVLQDFVDAMLPSIEKSLNQAAKDSGE